MNLILFEEGEALRPLPRTDGRAVHLLEVLRRREGDEFDAGLVDGPRGKGTLVRAGPDTLELRFRWGAEPPPAAPLHLLIGLPRPQTARKILQEAASLGVAALHFFGSEKGEPGYASSTLWTGGEWRRRLMDGAAQAFDTRLPAVARHPGLAEALAAARTLAGAPAEPTAAAPALIALDNYEATEPLLQLLGSRAAPDKALILAFGPERGWSPGERDRLRAAGFALAGLGPRVLRTETAVIAAVSIARAHLGWESN